MPKKNYKVTQDSEIITSEESESEQEEERIDVRNAPAEPHRAKKRIYYDRSRSQSIEYVERRRSASEERPRKSQHNTNTRYERSGHRPQHRDESFPAHRVPKYNSWSTEKPVTRKKCPREHTIHQTQPDKRKVVEKRERKATAIQPTSATKPGPSPTTQRVAAPVTQLAAAPTTQHVPVPVTQLAAAPIIQPVPVPGVQPTSAMQPVVAPVTQHVLASSTQINQATPAMFTGAQMAPDFFFKTLEYIEKIVKAGNTKRSANPDTIQFDLNKVKTEKTECITIADENSDACENKQIKIGTEMESSASTATDSTVTDESSMEVEKPTKKRIQKMVKIVVRDDLKEQKKLSNNQ